MERQRLRFTINDDITLLKETLCENPFEDAGKWSFIQHNVNAATSKVFTIRALKEHVQYLITSFTKEEHITKRKSGTDEEYNEIRILLQDVINLAMEFSSPDKKKKIKRPTVPIPINKIEDEGVTNMDYLVGSNRVPVTQTAVEFENVVKMFLKTQQQERAIRKEELELEKERFRLEEEKFKFERMKYETEAKEREMRLQMELKERNERLLADKEKRQMLLSLYKAVPSE